MRWIYVPNPVGFKPKPEWMRSAALADDGTIYAPAVIAGSEQEVLLCASFDGVSVAMDSGHLFVPTKWMAQEFKHAAEVCQKIEASVLTHFAK